MGSYVIFNATDVDPSGALNSGSPYYLERGCVRTPPQSLAKANEYFLNEYPIACVIYEEHNRNLDIFNVAAFELGTSAMWNLSFCYEVCHNGSDCNATPMTTLINEYSTGYYFGDAFGLFPSTMFVGLCLLVF